MPLHLANLLKQTAALTLVAIILLLGGASVSPTLHAHLHSFSTTECDAPCQSTDPEPASHPDHYCAVHLFQMGVTSFIDPPLPEAAVLKAEYLAASNWTALKTLRPLPGNRGPPMIGFAS